MRPNRQIQLDIGVPVSYRDLEVWKRAMDLAEAAYAIARSLPDTERYGLAQQMRRSAVSVPSCIAEGRSRLSTREFARFLAIAMGSLAELETQCLLAARLGLTREAIDPLLRSANELGRMLQSLRKSLDRNAYPQETRPNR
ncbi:MAG: four helix bundle protein [Xanthomonadales bacterium]|nr:four helix bundle protein [Xanthomonadales bacterium]